LESRHPGEADGQHDYDLHCDCKSCAEIYFERESEALSLSVSDTGGFFRLKLMLFYIYVVFFEPLGLKRGYQALAAKAEAMFNQTCESKIRDFEVHCFGLLVYVDYCEDGRVVAKRPWMMHYDPHKKMWFPTYGMKQEWHILHREELEHCKGEEGSDGQKQQLSPGDLRSIAEKLEGFLIWRELDVVSANGPLSSVAWEQHRAATGRERITVRTEWEQKLWDAASRAVPLADTFEAMLELVLGRQVT
jgi:hypothetical protein